MIDRRRTKRTTVGGLTLLNAFEQKAALMAGYACLYFLGHDGDADSDPIKVGYTYSVTNRMGQISGAGWRPIKLHDLLYVRGPMSAVTSRRFELILGDGLDDEKVAAAVEAAAELDTGTAHIASIETAVHDRLKAMGLHHSREWFRGGAALLISTARSVIAEQFAVPFHGHHSMRRLVASWSKEAGLT